jgi:hypothetical protein
MFVPPHPAFVTTRDAFWQGVALRDAAKKDGDKTALAAAEQALVRLRADFAFEIVIWHSRFDAARKAAAAPPAEAPAEILAA